MRSATSVYKFIDFLIVETYNVLYSKEYLISNTAHYFYHILAYIWPNVSKYNK